MMENMWNDEQKRWVDIFPDGNPLDEINLANFMPLWAISQRSDAALVDADFSSTIDPAFNALYSSGLLLPGGAATSSKNTG